MFTWKQRSKPKFDLELAQKVVAFVRMHNTQIRNYNQLREDHARHRLASLKPRTFKITFKNGVVRQFSEKLDIEAFRTMDFRYSGSRFSAALVDAAEGAGISMEDLDKYTEGSEVLSTDYRIIGQVDSSRLIPPTQYITMDDGIQYNTDEIFSIEEELC